MKAPFVQTSSIVREPSTSVREPSTSVRVAGRLCFWAAPNRVTVKIEGFRHVLLGVHQLDRAVTEGDLYFTASSDDGYRRSAFAMIRLSQDELGALCLFRAGRFHEIADPI